MARGRGEQANIYTCIRETARPPRFRRGLEQQRLSAGTSILRVNAEMLRQLLSDFQEIVRDQKECSSGSVCGIDDLTEGLGGS